MPFIGNPFTSSCYHADYSATSPLQILPCGRGEFMPVDNNESVEGRAHNRRTEIIMAPKLDKLMDILK